MTKHHFSRAYSSGKQSTKRAGRWFVSQAEKIHSPKQKGQEEDLRAGEDDFPIRDIPPLENMDDIVCEICVREFNESEVVPRVLECGHSVCTDCITQLLETTRSCPKCSNEMTQSSCEDYLVNQSLISIISSLRNSSTQKSILKRQLDKLIKEYSDMGTKWTESKEGTETKLSLIDEKLTQATDGLAQLQELNDTDEDEWDLETINMTLLDLRLKLDTTRNMNLESKQLHLKDFENSKLFLLEIYNGLINGERFYAMTKIGNQPMYGKISMRDNKIFIHAFSSIQLDQQQTIVAFQDIKKCMGEGTLGAFLQIICNANGIRQIILIKTVSTILTPQFLRFCTGESGPVYKGCPFYQGTGTSITDRQMSVLKVDKLIESDEKAAEYMAYDNILTYSQTYGNNDIIITTSLDGDFEIVKLFGDGVIQNSIGKIEEPNNLEFLVDYENENKIIDSGICVYI